MAFKRGDWVYKPRDYGPWIGVVVGEYIPFRLLGDQISNMTADEEHMYAVQCNGTEVVFFAKFHELRPYKPLVELHHCLKG